MLPIMTKAPETETGSGPVTEAEEPARKKIANRDWIKDDGSEATEDEATGVSYEFLGRTKDGATIPPDGEKVVVMFNTLSEPARNMLTGFGLVTLMGNVTNTWMGDKSDDKDAKAADAIRARLALLQDGQWIDRTQAAPRAIDKDALAEALVLYGIDEGKFTAEQAEAGIKAKLRQSVEDSAEYAKGVLTVAGVKNHYMRLLGKTVKSVEDVFAGIA